MERARTEHRDQQRSGGHAVLLSQIVERTEGRSLTANLALVRNNAAFAADVAVSDAARRSAGA
jgi:pseudouridine-5'-phosphate glycosidase